MIETRLVKRKFVDEPFKPVLRILEIGVDKVEVHNIPPILKA